MNDFIEKPRDEFYLDLSRVQDNHFTQQLICRKRLRFITSEHAQTFKTNFNVGGRRMHDKLRAYGPFRIPRMQHLK